MVARKTAAKAPSTEIANWDDELAKLGRAQKKTVADVGQGRFITFPAKQMTFNGEVIPDNTLTCIVLDSILLNTYYDPADGRFRADTPKSPVCFAFGVVDQEDPDADIVMAPDPESTKPQNDVCGKAGHEGCCEWNEWESAETGRGKACQNRRRLALIPFDEDNCEPSDIEATEHALMNTPVTSVRPWANFIKKIDTAYGGKPPLAFVTQVTCVPDENDQFHLTFELVSEVPKDIIGALLKKRLTVQGDLVKPYTAPEPEKAKPARSARSARSASKIAGKAPAPAKKPAARR